MYIEGICSKHFDCIWIPKLAGWRVWVVSCPRIRGCGRSFFKAILTRVLPENLDQTKTKSFCVYGCFLNWWYPTTMGFPTKNDHFGVFWGYHHLRKPPYMHPFFFCLRSSLKSSFLQTSTETIDYQISEFETM